MSTLLPAALLALGDLDPAAQSLTTRDQELLESRQNTTLLHQGRIVRLEEDHVRLANGRISQREVVRHPGAVAILAYDRSSNQLIMVRQFRYPVQKILLEIPAGKLDQGESPEDCARRELQEETGYRCGTLQHMHSPCTCVGFSDEVLHMYYTEDLEAGQANPDDGEILHCTLLNPEDALALLAAGRICDGKTQIALYWFLSHRMNSTQG